MRKARVVMVTAGACGVILAAGGATAALASIPSAAGVIHGCYRTASPHALTVVNSQTCPSGSTPLSWNQKGPVGPPGPTTSYTVAQGGSSVAGVGSFETASLTCPASHPLIISGGYDIENSETSPTDYSVVFSQPANANSWWVRIAVPADAPANVTWHVQGVCAS
jgi:hypothetical protein